MAPYQEELSKIIQQAEADLNTYQAKTGAAREQYDDPAGVRSVPADKFPGADIKYQGDELSTNASWNERIPPSEGGDLDARGRQARGGQYDHNEGRGDPQSQIKTQYDQNPGKNDRDVVNVPGVNSIGRQGEKPDVLIKGEAASLSNVGMNPAGVGGSKFRGEDYYNPESVPDSISAEGNVAPESVVQASREAEFGGFNK